MLIEGGHPLSGSIRAQGAKNAALPLMASALLLKGKRLELERVPDLQDIHTMADLLRHLGARVDFGEGRMIIDVPSDIGWETPSDLVRKMRASSLVLGPLIARCGKAVLPLPGGCAIGSRPIDFHLNALTRMGSDIELEQGSVHASTDGLRPARIYFDFPSVGATENILMAAALTEGETTIENAAREPEIVNLCEALRSMGAEVDGEGTGVIKVRGRRDLKSASVTIIPDRIEASTYLLAGVMTHGHVEVTDICPEYIEALTFKLEEAGVEVEARSDSISASCPGPKWKGVTLKTLPYPGFPTDLQPQIMATMSIADGTSVIHESVFDSRYMHVGEFKRMGAKIDIQGNTVVVTGVGELTGAEVHATDLRAGAALILMGLAASGTTSVCSLGHVWRGYEDLVAKLKGLGADITMVDGDEGE